MWISYKRKDERSTKSCDLDCVDIQQDIAHTTNLHKIRYPPKSSVMKTALQYRCPSLNVNFPEIYKCCTNLDDTTLLQREILKNRSDRRNTVRRESHPNTVSLNVQMLGIRHFWMSRLMEPTSTVHSNTCISGQSIRRKTGKL